MIKRSTITLKRWQETHALIIDESKSPFQSPSRQRTDYLVSMVDGTLFDKLEAIARIVRNSTKPFGGLQVRLFGHYQLAGTDR